MSGTMARAGLALALIAGGIGAAKADKIKNPTAVFSGLDKITGRIVSFEVATGETVQFGSLQLTSRVCYSRPPTENPTCAPWSIRSRSSSVVRPSQPASTSQYALVSVWR